MDNTLDPVTGLPAGVDPASLGGMTKEAFNNLAVSIAGILKPTLTAAAKDAVVAQLKEHQSLPPADTLASQGKSDAAPIEAEALVSEYFRHTLIPGYTEKGISDRGKIVKAVAGLKMPAGARVKADLSTVASGAGAELIATEYVRVAIEADPNITQFRRYVTVRQMTENTLDLPTVTAKPTSGYKAQLAPATQSSIATGRKQLIAKSCVSLTDPFSRELAADARTPFMQDMARYLGEADGVETSRVFAVGDGTDEPEGVATITGRDISMDDVAFGFADVIALIHGIGKQYRRGAVFLMNDALIAKARKVRDDNGRPILVDPLGPDLPIMLFGYPLVELPDIEGDGTVSDPTSVLFGNFKKGYWWGDRGQLEIASDVSGDNFKNNTMQLRGITRNDGKIVFKSSIVRMVNVI